MELIINLERKDWEVFQAYLQDELSKQVRKRRNGFFTDVAIWTVVLLFISFMMQYYGEFHWPTAFIVVVILGVIAAYFVVYLNRMTMAYAPSEEGPFIGEHRFNISEEGIASSSETYSGVHKWGLVKRIVRERGMIMIFIDTSLAFLFPEDRLQEPDRFYEYINECSNKM